jgi:predicted ferric reductase/Ca2+-binding EF-hand superfamily protein
VSTSGGGSGGQPAERVSLPAVDRRMLESLERRFFALAGQDRVIDAAELQRALGLESEMLSKRMLAIFDRDGSGSISRDEFIEGVRRLVLGSDADKLRFAFELHDVDGDGSIDLSELERMLAISLADAGVIARGSQDAKALAVGLMRAADTDGDGRIGLPELSRVLESRPEILREMTRSEAQWISPSGDVLAALERPPSTLTRAARLARFYANRMPLVLATLAWLLLNLVVFLAYVGRAIVIGRDEPWSAVGHAAGACLEVNAALVCFPVMRRFVTRVRASFVGRWLPVDDAIDIHRLVGHAIGWLAVLHGFAFVASYLRGHGLHNLIWLFLSTPAGASGAVLFGVLAIMWVFALAIVRRSRWFEAFHFTHLLYVAFFALAIVHAPGFAYWALLATGGLLLEQGIRALRRSVRVNARSVEPLRSGVTRIELDKPKGFAFRAGDYAFLRVPAIAKHEWHPFTISSAPEEDYLTIHVRTLGNWTSALRKLAEAHDRDPSKPAVVVHLDGPYGSPATHIERAKNAIVVGAGIGVTPFASVLPSLFRRRLVDPANLPRKVHFFWLNRDQYSFEWFHEMLADLEDDAGAALDLRLYMTNGRRGATSLALEAARHVAHAEGKGDVVTSLRTMTRMGQPDWERELADIAKEHEAGSVELFFCGPAGLGTKVRAACAKAGIPFHEERF